MKATIAIVNSDRGIYAAQMENGEYVIFELLDSSGPDIGDKISHPDFYSMGGETFRNVTQKCSIDVYVQNVCSASLVRQQCML